MKKTFSTILIISMLAAFIPNNICAGAELTSQITEASENTALAVFGEEILVQNINKVVPCGLFSYETAEGRSVVQIKKHSKHPRDASENGRIYIDISDGFFCGNTDGTEFVLTVDYVDDLKGFFNIKYDGLDGEHSTETVYLGTGGGLKSKRFVLSDANFANGINGFDIEIGFPGYEVARSEALAQIAGITLEKYAAENPVMVDIHTDEAGNVFNPQTGVLMHNTFKNYSGSERRVTVAYTAKNKLGNIEWQGSESLTLAPHEEKTIDSKPQISTFGLYYYSVEILGLGVDFVKETPFSYINTAQDGSINEKMGYCTHLCAGFTDEEINDILELVKKSNSNLIRNDFTWAYTENVAKGVYNFSYYDTLLKTLQNKNMRALLIAGFGNTLYTESIGHIPTDETAINAYVNWVSKAIDEYGMDLDDFMFEIWNEPNLSTFASNGIPEIYANFAASSASKLKTKYPDIKIGALALTGLTMPEETHHTKEFFQQAADKGVFDNAYAFTVHPYASMTSAERSGMISAIKDDIKILSDAGYPDVKLWNSEVGWSTARKVNMFTERQQSAYHQRYFVLMDELEANEYYWIYDLIDDGNLKTEYEDRFGILENAHYPESGVPLLASEAFAALTNMNNILAGCEKPLKVETGINDIYAYMHKDNKRNRSVLTIWRDGDNVNETIRVNLGVNRVTFVDSYGNETELESDSGIYDVIPDFELSYLIGDFENVSIGASSLKVSELNLDVLSEGTAEVKITGIENASKAVIKENAFVQQENSTVNGGQINLKLQIPELTESKTGFNILLKDGSSVRSVIRLYLDKRETLGANFNDNFENYFYDLDINTNNRKDSWWIESANNEDISDYVRVSSVTDGTGTTMDKALTLLPTESSGLTGKHIRGGRGLSGTVGAGETLTVEFDIYAADDTAFTLGVVPSDRAYVEDGVQSYLFHIDTRNTDTVYYHSDQGTLMNPLKTFSGITFNRNEINHVKVDYIFNTDVSDGTKDTIKLTVKNSAGESSATAVVGYRYTAFSQADAPKPLTEIKGISFMKWDYTSTMYLDNVKVESDRHYYLNDDFSILNNGSNDADNNRIYTWRIESGNNQDLTIAGNSALTKDCISVASENEMSDALKLSPTKDEDAALGGEFWKKCIRAGIGWNGSVGAGETLTVELDIYAQKDTAFSIGAVSEQRNYRAEESAEAYFFHINSISYSSDALSNKSDMYYHREQGMTDSPSNKYSDLVFMRNEVNHVKIEYTLNEDVSRNNGDTMTLTVTNSNGTTSQTVKPMYRYVAYTQTNPPKALTGIRGISFIKWDNTSTMYLDNIKVYKDNPIYPTAVINADNINVGDNSIVIDFSNKMNVQSLADNISVKCDGETAAAAGSLDETGRIYTLTLENGFKAGSEYTVTVPKNTTDNAALPLSKDISAKFVPKNREAILEIVQDGKVITADKIVDRKDITVKATVQSSEVGKKVLICIAGYNENNNLTELKFKNVYATEKTMDFVTDISEAKTYKIFLWSMENMQPLCKNL